MLRNFFANRLDDQAQQMENFVSKKQEFMRNILQDSFSKAEKYTTVITAGGYVAFFTAWGGVSDQLPFFDKAWSLLTILFSLLVFISWEIFKMIKYSFLSRLQLKVCLSDISTYQSEETKLLEEERKYQNLNIQVWPNILILSIVPAVLAIFFLIRGTVVALLVN